MGLKLKPELSLEESLGKIFYLINPKKGLISSVKRAPFYHDEPKLFNYTAILRSNLQHSDGLVVNKFAGGTSFFQKTALMKALGEAIERYSLSVYKEECFVKASYKDLKGKALDPSTVVSFNNAQLRKKKFHSFLYNEKTRFKWVKGYSFKQGKGILVPAQLVYVPYRYKGEKIIRFPITTGAASGTSLSGAIYRGICEVIERDAFVINYLNKLPREKVDLEKSAKKIKELEETFRRYHLELSIFDLTTDIPLPVLACFLIDRTRIGPAVSVGLAADLNPVTAAIKAMEESQHSRPWIRGQMEKASKNKKDVCTLEGRGLLWSDVRMISKLNFLLRTPKTISLKHIFKEEGVEKKAEKAIKILLKLNYDIIFVDVSISEVKKRGFYVVKVIIPQLQPLYLDEHFPYLGGERLYKTPVKMGILESSRVKLNTVPHPFL